MEEFITLEGTQFTRQYGDRLSPFALSCQVEFRVTRGANGNGKIEKSEALGTVSD